jgi:predicted regulator of Ras-like GTPase activity (Roadblock/LC7/MglB family)
MSFRESLKQLTQAVPGGLGAFIMGYDGIAIDEYLSAELPLDLPLLAVEYVNLMREIKRTVELLDTGGMEEVVVATDRVRVLTRVINDDFFLVLVITANGNYGKGRFLLMRDALKFRAEL